MAAGTPGTISYRTCALAHACTSAAAPDSSGSPGNSRTANCPSFAACTSALAVPAASEGSATAASAASRCRTRSATSASATTRPAAPSSRAPRRVISPSSPGPAPTNATQPSRASRRLSRPSADHRQRGIPGVVPREITSHAHHSRWSSPRASGLPRPAPASVSASSRPRRAASAVSASPRSRITILPLAAAESSTAGWKLAAGAPRTMPSRCSLPAARLDRVGADGRAAPGLERGQQAALRGHRGAGGRVVRPWRAARTSSVSAVRHSTASAPWPGAGTMVSGSKISLTRSVWPILARPA